MRGSISVFMGFATATALSGCGDGSATDAGGSVTCGLGHCQIGATCTRMTGDCSQTCKCVGNGSWSCPPCDDGGTGGSGGGAAGGGGSGGGGGSDGGSGGLGGGGAADAPVDGGKDAPADAAGDAAGDAAASCTPDGACMAATMCKRCASGKQQTCFCVKMKWRCDNNGMKCDGG